MTKGEANQFVLKLTASSCRRLANRITPEWMKRQGCTGKYTNEDCALIGEALNGFAERIDKLLQPVQPQTDKVEA